MRRDVVPHHLGGLLEHISEQAAAQEGLTAWLKHQIVTHRDGQLAHGGDMCPKCGIIGGFISANNNREWYHAHKAEYQAANAQFEELVQSLIRGSEWRS